MQNVVIWRFHDEPVYPALVRLQQEGAIDIKAWFGDTFRCPYCTHEIFDLLRTLSIKHEYHPFDWEIYQKVYPSMFQFIKLYIPRRRLYYSRSMHDFAEMFNILFNYFYRLLNDSQVDTVLFGFIPHQGPEYVLYEVAKAMNIKTVMVLQSTDFPNKFFYSYSIEDFSDWKNNDVVSDKPVHMPRKYEKKLLQVKLGSFRLPRKEDWDKLKRSLAKTGMKWRNFDIFYDMQWRIMNWKKNREYRKALKENCRFPDFQKNFVYFPLHYQPELTTEVLGGIFVDQALAIERLHDMLPDDWFIYVKDYPRLQTAIMRPPKFFDRLKALPKVRMVHQKVNTYDLIKHSKFVATITGSAGWEAISGGKCALVFGQAWYKSLPGVFVYHEGLTIQEILDFQIDHEDMQKKLGMLMGKMGEGIVDPHSIVLYKEYDEATNIDYLTTFFTRVLDKSIEAQK